MVFETPLKAKEDERGALVELFKLPNDGQVFLVAVNALMTRGNHYHKRKTEQFCVVAGQAIITLKKGKDVGKFAVSGDDPHVIKIPPGYAHNIQTGEGGCLLMVWVNEKFDENNPDTYEAKL